ncbi:hypothetical protein SGPA1_60243 [Streptomyces misionensis JCM 4497]
MGRDLHRIQPRQPPGDPPGCRGRAGGHPRCPRQGRLARLRDRALGRRTRQPAVVLQRGRGPEDHPAALLPAGARARRRGGLPPRPRRALGPAHPGRGHRRLRRRHLRRPTADPAPPARPRARVRPRALARRGPGGPAARPRRGGRTARGRHPGRRRTTHGPGTPTARVVVKVKTTTTGTGPGELKGHRERAAHQGADRRVRRGGHPVLGGRPPLELDRDPARRPPGRPHRPRPDRRGPAVHGALDPLPPQGPARAPPRREGRRPADGRPRGRLRPGQRPGRRPRRRHVRRHGRLPAGAPGHPHPPRPGLLRGLLGPRGPRGDSGRPLPRTRLQAPRGRRPGPPGRGTGGVSAGSPGPRLSAP